MHNKTCFLVHRCRQCLIQNMLRMVGYGENLGSGFPLILDAWIHAGWNTPVLNNKFELVLPLSAISENVPNSTVEITPSVENDDGEKSREGSGGRIRNMISSLCWTGLRAGAPLRLAQSLQRLRSPGYLPGNSLFRPSVGQQNDTATTALPGRRSGDGSYKIDCDTPLDF